MFVLTQAKPRTRLQMQAVMALAKHGKLAPTVIQSEQGFHIVKLLEKRGNRPTPNSTLLGAHSHLEVS